MKIRYFKDDMDLVMVEGAEAAATIAVEKLNLIMGEWYRDETVGIPWMTSVLGQSATQGPINFICNYIVNELSTIPEITAVDITEANFDPKTRKLSLKITMSHTEEDITLEQTYGV